MVSAQICLNVLIPVIGVGLTVIRLPEVNESPVKPDFRLFLSVAVGHTVVPRIWEHERVGTNSLEPFIISQVQYASDKQVDAKTRKNGIYRGSMDGISN